MKSSNVHGSGDRAAAWRESAADGPTYAGRHPGASEDEYPTLTYEVTDRVVRITFNRPARKYWACDGISNRVRSA